MNNSSFNFTNQNNCLFLYYNRTDTVKIKLSTCILFFLIVFVAGSVQASSDTYSRDSMLNLLGHSKYEQAIEYLEQFKDSMTAKDDSLKIEWLIDHSITASITLDTDTAFKSILEAISIANTMNSPHLHFKATIHLIEIYRKMRFYDEALSIVRKQRIHISQQNEYLQCRFYHRAAAVYNEINYSNNDETYIDTAIMYSLRSLETSENSHYKESIATSLNELGNIYERIGKMEEALKVYNRSILLWKNLNDLNHANAIKNKGSYFLRQQQYDSAIYYFKEVISHVSDDQFLMYADTYEGLKKVYLALGDSLNYFKYNFLEADYSTLDAEQRLKNRILDLTMDYEAREKDALIEKSKNEITRKRQQNKIIVFLGLLLVVILFGVFYVYLLTRKKNRALNHLLKENEFLAGESNHRIKNNLQLIISIIGREIHKSKDSKPELIAISDKINSIATLHQHLYLNDSKEKIAIGSYLNSIVENFDGSDYLREIDLKFDVKDFDLPIEKSVYLGLLITEMLTNSIKHAFPEDFQKAKEISFSVSIEGDEILLEYMDNGIGLKIDQQPALVKLLTQQLKGKVSQKESYEGYYILLNFKP